MRMSVWVKENIAKEVQQLMGKHSLRFEGNPIHIGDEFNFVIVGDVEDFNNFNVEFNKLQYPKNDSDKKKKRKTDKIAEYIKSWSKR